MARDTCIEDIIGIIIHTIVHMYFFVNVGPQEEPLMARDTCIEDIIGIIIHTIAHMYFW